MKKLLCIALIGLSIASCKKNQATNQSITVDTIKFTVSNISANNTYNVSSTVTTTNVLTITNATVAKTYAIPVTLGNFILFNWSFVLSGQYQGSGLITISRDGKNIYQTGGYAGSYSFKVD